MSPKKLAEFICSVIILAIVCIVGDYLLSALLGLIVYLFDRSSAEAVFRWAFIFSFAIEMAVFIPVLYREQKRKD